MNPVRPEHRLLALSLPFPGEGVEPEIISLCRLPLDWSYLLDSGHRVGALQLLGEALRRSGAAVPGSVSEACQEALTRGTMRLLIATRVMGELQEILQSAGVRVLVLKGLPLAYEIYPHPGMRPVGDLDLLVPRASADAALTVLRDRGYRRPDLSLPTEFFRTNHFHVTLLKEGRGIPVEIHWDTQPFFSLSRIPEPEFWAGARPLALRGFELMVPGREESFLFLAQHLMRHLLAFGPYTWDDLVGALLQPARRGRLAWIADLALLAQSGPGLDWRRVQLLSSRWGLDDEIAGLRMYLIRRGGWPGHPDVAGVGIPAAGRALSMVDRVAAQFPALSRPSSALQMRPILALRLMRFAFPGSGWIRWRYDLGKEVGRARVAWRTLQHAAATFKRAASLAAAIVVFRLRDGWTRAGARGGESRARDASAAGRPLPSRRSALRSEKIESGPEMVQSGRSRHGV